METDKINFTEDQLQKIGMLYTLIDYYYERPRNSTGGCLHILLDDGNYDSVTYCLKGAENIRDVVAITICNYLKEFTEDEIENILTNRWMYLDDIDSCYDLIHERTINFYR